MIEKIISTEYAMQQLGSNIAKAIKPGCSIALYGDLGVGKTTLVRGFLTSLGHTGTVKSPTYTLVETYLIGNLIIHHFDLYRLKHVSELEFMGIRDYFNANTLCLIEWPEKGKGTLPLEDVSCTLEYTVDMQRNAKLVAHTPQGEQLLILLSKDGINEE